MSGPDLRGHVHAVEHAPSCSRGTAPAGWEVAETGSEPRQPEIDRELDASVLPYGVITDFLIAELIDRAPGPGSVRPFEHPRLPEVQIFYGFKTRTPYVRIRTKNLAWERVEYMDSGSVGPFPVELPPGLSAAQRRLVGEGWRFKHFSQDGPEVALMESPGGVEMWVYPGGSKSFGPGTYSLSLDDGTAARQTREARADRFEDVDGRVQGVDRG